MTIATPSFAERFWSKVSKSNTCWLWTGPRDRNGHGFSRDHDALYNASKAPVQQVAWTLYYGFSVKVKRVKQTCGNALCVRLEHLEAEEHELDVEPVPLVSAQKVFDACLDQVRRFQATSGKLIGLYDEQPGRGGRRPTGNTGSEYIADFQVAGVRALKRWPKRVEVFKLYFVQDRDRREVCKELKLSEGTLNWWYLEIKKTVGRELRRSPLYPPSQYRLRSVRKDEANG